jgi:hypothetical protein
VGFGNVARTDATAAALGAERRDIDSAERRDIDGAGEIFPSRNKSVDWHYALG